MSVVIRGMKMPIKCGLCPCFHAEWPMYCQAVKADKNKRIVAPYGMPRPEWCPLVELPAEHGRLGDVEWLKLTIAITLEHLTRHPLMNEKEIMLKSAFKTLELMVDDAPTVIEAEEVSE